MAIDVGSHAPQRCTVPTAQRLAAELYGLTATAQPLPGEYDDNFRLTTADGAASVLKVMHPRRERGFVDLQCAALAHVATRAPHLPVPRVVRARSGEAYTLVDTGGGTPRLVWVLSYLPGRLLVEARPRSAALLEALGRFLGELDAALADFSHPAADRELKWDFTRAAWIAEHLGLVRNPARRALVEGALARYGAEVVPALPSLRRSVVHHDANDYNVLVAGERAEPREVGGLIDFGDMLRTVTVAEVAVAAAYALLGQADALAAAARVVAGYHATFPLEEREIALLDALIRTRLAVSVVNSACRTAREPGDPYLAVSEAPAWDALERLASVHPRLAHYA